MDELKSLSDGFKLKHELFINGCDSLEAQRKWDRETRGEMETYFLGDIMSIVIYLASADGEITTEETVYLNDMLGFKNSTKTYKDIYKSCKSEIDNIAQNKIPEGIKLLSDINTELAAHYKEMLQLSCKIVAMSDCFVTTEEDAIIKQINLITV